jgi:hypothetical protein
MSIASEISRLSGVREDIFTSITSKGVTVPATATFSSCPALIDSITGGGGGSPTDMVNTAFTASGFLSGYRPFTATQIEVPEYDTVSGNYATGGDSNYYVVQIPMKDFSGENVDGYEMTLKFQSWNSEQSTIVVIPNSADRYSNQFGTNIRTDQFYSDTSYQPPLYYHTFDAMTFHYWWSQIQDMPWISTAFTGSYVYIMFQLFSNPQNIQGDWKYLVQTGTNVPYPTYPTTTTGYVQNTIDLKEYFSSPNVKFSGFNNKVINYDNSPSDSTETSTNTANVTAFNNNGLKNWQMLSFNALDSNYSYSYGSIDSGYSGFEGI